jgi:hypothetical protein
VFRWRAVEARKRNGGSETVVKLVVASVKLGKVKNTMDVIGQHLVRNVAPNEVSHNLLERGQSRRNDEDRAEVGEIAESNLKSNVRESDEDCVADAVDDFGTGRLSMWLRLMFVRLGEFWETNVDELIDSCR